MEPITFMSLVKTIAMTATIELDDFLGDVEDGLESMNEYNYMKSPNALRKRVEAIYDRAIDILGYDYYDKTLTVDNALNYVELTA